MPSEENFLNLEHKVERHDGELDQLLERIETLEDDLELILSPQVGISKLIIGYASQVGNSAYDQAVAQKCADLLKRHGLRAK
jgi:hypothetical protein